jgi:hypothetical protein
MKRVVLQPFQELIYFGGRLLQVFVQFLFSRITRLDISVVLLNPLFNGL